MVKNTDSLGASVFSVRLGVLVIVSVGIKAFVAVAIAFRMALLTRSNHIHNNHPGPEFLNPRRNFLFEK